MCGICPTQVPRKAISPVLFGPGCSGYIGASLPHPAPPHTPQARPLMTQVTVLGGSQKPDHFVVYMSLESCASKPIKNTPKEGEMRASEMDSQTPGRGFIAESGSLVFSQREPLGTIHAQLTKAMSFLPASHSCLPLGRRSLGRLVRLDPLGEGASTDLRLAFCSLEAVGGVGCRQVRGEHFFLLWVSTPPPKHGRPPHHALRPNSLLTSLPSSFAKIRTLKEISSTLDPGHSGPSPAPVSLGI